MGRFFLLLLLLPFLASAQAPPIAAAWQADVLQVEVSNPDTCLYLVGNLRPQQWIGCGETHYALAPGGVDQNRAPMNRILVVADYHTGQELARLRAPPRILLALPDIVAPETPHNPDPDGGSGL